MHRSHKSLMLSTPIKLYWLLFLEWPFTIVVNVSIQSSQTCIINRSKAVLRRQARCFWQTRSLKNPQSAVSSPIFSSRFHVENLIAFLLKGPSQAHTNLPLNWPELHECIIQYLHKIFMKSVEHAFSFSIFFFPCLKIKSFVYRFSEDGWFII